MAPPGIRQEQLDDEEIQQWKVIEDIGIHLRRWKPWQEAQHGEVRQQLMLPKRYRGQVLKLISTGLPCLGMYENILEAAQIANSLPGGTYHFPLWANHLRE